MKLYSFNAFALGGEIDLSRLAGRLQQRYQEIKHKSETLLDVTDVFSSLSHARRAARLEWIIIILIAIEIFIYLLEIFRKQ